MNNRPTPETDSFAIKFKTTCGEKYWVPVEFARKLERERDEANKELSKKYVEYDQLFDEAEKIRIELEMWRDGNIMHEIHRNELEKVEQERDEARGMLKKISDLFIDGTDIYADYENMGMIARNALEETK